MSCFPCFGKRKKDNEGTLANDGNHQVNNNVPKNHEAKPKNTDSQAPAGSENIQAQSFTFRELATATKNFTPDCLLGEGGLGRVYKGCLENGQVVAIKQLGRNSLQDSKEFLQEISKLSLLQHPNLVNLVGYCADGEQRLLVHEFIPKGPLEDRLFDLKPDQVPLDWYTRMRIAYGAAQGLEYLHDKANPPVIYRDLKSSNFLLDNDLIPKLSDFGLGKLGPSGDKPMLSSSIMGTYGYCAPEYSMGGEVTLKSDLYSFGVVLLELITGRRALDTSMPSSEQNLVSWAQPYFHDQKRYPELVDPKMKDNYPVKGLNQAVAIASMCIQNEPSVRPIVADVVMTLGFLIEPMHSPQPSPVPDQAPQPKPESDDSDASYTDSEGSSEHVVETLQLGKRRQVPKPRSRSNSKSSSSHGSASSYESDSSSCSNSSSKNYDEADQNGSKRRMSSKKRSKKLNSSSKRPIYDDYGSKKCPSKKVHSKKLSSSSKNYEDMYESDENKGSLGSKHHEEVYELENKGSLSAKHSKKHSKKIRSNSKAHEEQKDASGSESEKSLSSDSSKESPKTGSSKHTSLKLSAGSSKHENYNAEESESEASGSEHADGAEESEHEYKSD